MQFRFQPLRATQAASLLVRLAGGRLNYTKAVKLLHLADRQSLLETASPITGDAVYNMANGPVLSTVYDCIKDNARECASWRACLRKDGYDLVLVNNPGDSELSDYDVEVLEALHRRYLSYDFSDMIKEVHRLPEWRDPTPEGRVYVSPDQILHAAGAPPETALAYNDLNASVRPLDAIRVIRQ